MKVRCSTSPSNWASPRSQALFSGIELADSFIVDPHKWLFAPFDACALIYKDPEIARAAHTQHAGYLETLDSGQWNPSDYAIHLTRRVRGLPFWFSLATHGTDKYAESMDKTMDLARASAQLIRQHPNLELLMEPELS
ncbi:MAG: aspartate aminotransferase family protein, partial [Actinobacteria bacterium]|nr:aspartate aminotransferase family protein [Actinomycetota bacterium]